MHILLTGASSFTGFWFARMLVDRGAQVLASLSGPDEPKAYSGIRADRVSALKEFCRLHFGVPFGSADFLDLVAGEPRIDVVCHHWSHVRNYKSSDFDAFAAAAANTRRLPDLLRILKAKGCRRIVITGSVGENDEGVGSKSSAFNAYALSKHLSYEFARYHCEREAMILDKFVIPNPFGPFEEHRFTHQLMTSWFAGQAPTVITPLYVRDNIHVDLLAKAYAQFVLEGCDLGIGQSMLARRMSPSGYIETQGAFAERVAREVSHRLKIPCPLELSPQREFLEPMIRINTDVPDAIALGWDERAAWDGFANYYRKRLEK